MKAILWALSLPHLIVAMVIEALRLDGIQEDLAHCLEIARKYGRSVPEPFIYALIIAEDHRSALHPGIDPIAMMRAIWVRVISGQIQGASTIEQQFVRTVTNRYHRTLSRKLREQILALMLTRKVSKREISSAYLSIAFFGAGCIGILGLKRLFGNDLSRVGIRQAFWMVSQLKYPRPLIPTTSWHSKVSTRTCALVSRMEVQAKSALQSTLQETAEFKS